MESSQKTELWKQFGAAIDMFENAVNKCPGKLWNEESKFWYITYHTLFFLDLYLTEEPNNFAPLEPYTLSELDEGGIMPDRVYTKEELLSYTQYCREKCRKLIGEFNPEKRWLHENRDYSMFEMTLYNMRHVMHHTGQLNLLLGKVDHGLPIWVSRTKIDL